MNKIKSNFKKIFCSINWFFATLTNFFNNLGKRGLSFNAFACAIASGYFTASLYTVLSLNKEGILFTTINFVNRVDIQKFFILFFMVSTIIVLFTLLWERAVIAYAFLLTTAVLFLNTLVQINSKLIFKATYNVDLVFLIGIAIIIIIIMKFLLTDDKLMLGKLSSSKFFSSWTNMYSLTAICVIAFTVIASTFSYYSYLTFSNSTFDFGIFTQMFENMRKTGLPLTTVERGRELSHFAVHFSPSWYLLLPGYLIFPSPLYLNIANAFVIAIGAFPIFRICKKLGSSPAFAFSLSLIYLLFPSMAAGTLWDIHENSLLPVLILYMVYFFLDKKIVPMLIFTLLTLGSKEDAAIYVIAFALYIIFGTKRKWTGALLLVFSMIYFIFAIKMIKVFGGEAMISRLSMYFPESNKGFSGVIKTCFTNIGYLIRNIFDLNSKTPSTAKSAAALFSEGKFQFILWMLVPVLFAPFLSKKTSLILLLIPMMVINLMPSWIYQYNIYYQYTYGPAALIILSTVFAFIAMDKPKKIIFVSTSLILCFLFSGALFWPKATRVMEKYKNNKQMYVYSQETITMFLDEYYNEGDSVSANCFIVPHLSKVSDLYTVPIQGGGVQKSTDWFIQHKNYTSANYNPPQFKNYKCINPNDNSYIRIYKKVK